MTMKVIEGFPNYMITEDGRIYCIKYKRFKKEKPGGFKIYPRVELWKDGVRYHRWIHRLVCQHFVGCCDGKHTHHKNGKPSDNRAKNLAPLTQPQHVKAHRKLKKKQRKKAARELRKDCPF